MGEAGPEPYTRLPEGTTIWISDQDDQYIYPPYQIRTADGDIVVESESADYPRVKAYAAIVDQYGDVSTTDESALVPVEIAADGKPALSMYLYGVLDWPRDEIAEVFDVKEESVRKYLQRFRPWIKRVD